jgi:hypothetical protein
LMVPTIFCSEGPTRIASHFCKAINNLSVSYFSFLIKSLYSNRLLNFSKVFRIDSGSERLPFFRGILAFQR